MARLSQLTDGGAPEAGDELLIARQGASRKVDIGALIDLFFGPVQRVSTSTTLGPSIALRVKQTVSGLTTSLDPSPEDGDTLEIKNADPDIGQSNTVDGNGNTIEGQASIQLFGGESVKLVFDALASDWSIF
jgi:hypothetical protein